jgi:hypothetical protein
MHGLHSMLWFCGGGFAAMIGAASCTHQQLSEQEQNHSK